MSATRSGRLDVPGASIFHKTRGDGPLLLVLQGGDGDADGANALVRQLTGEHAVATYDRRGLWRSPVDDPAAPVRVQTHGDDAAALLAALTDEPALVFGSSIGALIGLDLATRHPERVRVLVAHEPPAQALLPDAERAGVERAQQEIDAIYRRDGAAAAAVRLAVHVGLDVDPRDPEATWPRPSDRLRANLERFLTVDSLAARRFSPDLDALRAGGVTVVPAAGRESRDHWLHQCVVALAAALGTAVTEFPGGHNGYVAHPKAFAARLREVLAGVASTGAPPA